MELQNIIQKFKHVKPLGYDKVTGGIVKNMRLNATELLLRLVDKIWKEEQFPKD